jgi:hypothetical protein
MMMALVRALLVFVASNGRKPLQFLNLGGIFRNNDVTLELRFR